MKVAAALLVIGFGVLPGEAAAQSAPRVFFDCSGPRCDSRYYRTEIGWVHWVNRKEAADLHLIMTSQQTGAGGREYLFDFAGTGEQAAYRDRRRFRSLPTETERETLDGIVHTLSLGLALFADEAGFRQLIRIAPADRAEAAAQRGVVSEDEVEDPWNLWVFRLEGEAGIDGETQSRSTSLEGEFSASRVTPEWRVRFSGEVEHDRLAIELSEGTFRDARTGWDAESEVVYALFDHWSTGMDVSASRNVTYNQKFRFEATPAIEYSVFPYDEATRRSFTFHYTIGPAYRNYVERTIYDQLSETRWEQAMDIRFSQRQRWGNASVNLRGSHFLHDFSQRLVRLGGYLSYRLARGFEVSVSGDVSSVRDQIYLSAKQATDEEALLELQQRATDFDYSLEIGVEFQFGSIYNNVVNNRFRRRRF